MKVVAFTGCLKIYLKNNPEKQPRGSFMKNNPAGRLFLKLTFFCFGLLLMSCNEQDVKPTITSFQSMGTTIWVQPPSAVPIVRQIFEETDALMSEWKVDSALTEVNEQSGVKPVQVSEELFNTIESAIEIAKMTDGAFDPTWASLWELWKFDGSNIVPTQSQINALLPFVDWKQVVLDKKDKTIFLPHGMIGLGGFAKGAALDLVTDTLLDQGVSDFMIIAGGQVIVQGDARIVGIRKPSAMQHELIAKVKIKNQSISTTGNYEKFFMKDGIRYHHIIDPRTGFPAKGMKSVTVISLSATLADALSTALFVMGADKGLQFIDDIPHTEALFIDVDHQLRMSRNFRKFFCDSHSIEGSAGTDLIPASDE